MAKRTFQKTSQLRPKERLKNIGLSIGCGACGTFRVFKVDEVLQLIKERETAGHVIESRCEKCNTLIEVIIGWIDATKLGYSYRRTAEFPVTEHITVVSDENGLKRPTTEHIT